MHYRRLGKTDLSVSAVSLGSWALGGGYDWGPTDLNAAQETVAAALDAGINLIDTAPVYGQSEEVLGRVLRGKRQNVFLSTKCGLVKNRSWTDHDLSPQTIITQLENSLKQLQTDYIDLYFIHYLDPRVPWQEVLQTLARLKEQGKICHLGVCNVPADILTDMACTGVISCVQDELSLLHGTRARKLLEICRAHDLGFMAYGPLCGGILSGKYQREPNLRRADARNYFYKCYRGENFARAQQIVNNVVQLAEQKGVYGAAVSLAWVLAQPSVSCALAGARSASQVRVNAAACEVKLSAEELCNLQK